MSVSFFCFPAVLLTLDLCMSGHRILKKISSLSYNRAAKKETKLDINLC